MSHRIVLLVLALVTCNSHILAGEPIPIQYFGLVMHRLDSGTPWPPFRFGTWRLWDAYVGWPDLEPVKGQWNFKRLDLYVKAAEAKGVELIYPLGLCAPWASARPNEPSGYKPGYAAEPIDIEDWRRYVRTVAERYKGRIKYYEVWNEPSDKLYFTGAPAKLTQLIRVAYETLKEVDPTIKVISPGFAGGGRHLRYLDELLELGASKYVDIVGYHFYVQKHPPEAMLPLIRDVRQIMRARGLGTKPLWNTETGWWISNGDGTPDHPMVAKGGWKRLDANSEAGAMMIRAFLLAYSEGVERFVWYSWDNRYGLGILEPTAMTPKPLARHYQNAVNAFEGWSIEMCSETAHVWSCKLTRAGHPDRVVAWAIEDSVSWAAPRGATKVTSLETNHTSAIQGRNISLSMFPVVVW